MLDFKDLAKITQREVVIAATAGVILSYTVGVEGTAGAFLLATCSVTGWQLTKEYFRFANDTHWLSEWFAILGRSLVGICFSLAIALTAWWLEQRSFKAPGWAAIFAGGAGFGVPVSVILAWWRLRGRVP